MSGSVLVLDQEAPEESSVVELVADVLVFDEEQSAGTLLIENGGDLLLIDAPTGDTTVVETPGDFLLIDAEPEVAMVTDDVGAPVLVITSSGPTGPEGPAGPPGQDGMGVDYYAVFNFAVSSDTWVITHNQATFALNVETFDYNGDLMEGSVEFTDSTTITIYWYYPQTGEARVFH